MRTVALPVAIIAGVTLYAGLYHVLIHARVHGRSAPAGAQANRGRRRDLYFGVLALLLGLFDLVCVGLYTSQDLAEGAVWQRIAIVLLAFSSTCLIYFIDEYAGVPGPTWWRRMSWILSALGLVALFERRGWLLTDVPSIKYLESWLFGPVVYYEREPGPLFYCLNAGVIYVIAYAIAVARRAYRAGQGARAEVLKSRGYQVHAAASLAEVRSTLTRLRGLELLITDVILPDGDGPTVRARVVADFPGVRCLFITGHAEELLAPRGMLREGTHRSVSAQAARPRPE